MWTWGKVYIMYPLATLVVLHVGPGDGRKKGRNKYELDEPDFESAYEFSLMQTLFDGYDTSVRPRYNSSQSVSVSVRFSLQQIYDLEWFDEFLVWEPSHFGGISKIVVDPRRLWTPKLAIGNSADKMFHAWKHFWITILDDGFCRWQPGGNFAFTCALDMNYYPFDEQTCTMEIETWFYTSDKVALSNSMDQFGLETYIPHGEWGVVNTSVAQKDAVYKYYAQEEFPEIYFTISLRRKYTFYFMYILLPCIMLSFVLLMTFLLPAESGEKVSLGVSILVSFSVFLIIVADMVPDTSDAVPIIAIYLMYFMMATALSVMSSTLILKLHYHGLDKEPPYWLRVLVFDVFAPMLCMQSSKKWREIHRKCIIIEPSTPEVISNEQTRDAARENARSHSINSETHTKDNKRERPSLSNSIPMMNLIAGPLKRRVLRGPNACTLTNQEHIQREWQRISEVLDRLFFWMFLIFIMIPLVSLVGLVRIFQG